MSCINPDGSLTGTAERVLSAIEGPSKDTEIAARMSFPVYLVRSSLRELVHLGLIDHQDGQYERTALGQEALEVTKTQ